MAPFYKRICRSLSKRYKEVTISHKSSSYIAYALGNIRQNPQSPAAAWLILLMSQQLVGGWNQ